MRRNYKDTSFYKEYHDKLPLRLKEALASFVDNENYEEIAQQREIKCTLDLVARAFPGGVSEEDYLPLLTLFFEFYVLRGLEVLADHWTKDPDSPPNDVLWAGEEPSPREAVERVRRKLEAVDSTKWLRELEETQRKQDEEYTKRLNEQESLRDPNARHGA